MPSLSLLPVPASRFPSAQRHPGSRLPQNGAECAICPHWQTRRRGPYARQAPAFFWQLPMAMKWLGRFHTALPGRPAIGQSFLEYVSFLLAQGCRQYQKTMLLDKQGYGRQGMAGKMEPPHLCGYNKPDNSRTPSFCSFGDAPLRRPNYHRNCQGFGGKYCSGALSRPPPQNGCLRIL